MLPSPLCVLCCRVLYFTFSVMLCESLAMVMLKELEPISQALFRIAVATGWLVVPYFDALSPEVVGPALLRFVRTAYMQAHACTPYACNTLAAGDLGGTAEGLCHWMVQDCPCFMQQEIS